MPKPSRTTTLVGRVGASATREFRHELLAQVSRLRGGHYGEELRQADEAHAVALL